MNGEIERVRWDEEGVEMRWNGEVVEVRWDEVDEVRWLNDEVALVLYNVSS